MSTNIHYGFRLPSDSAQGVAAWVQSLSGGIHTLQRAHLFKAYASLFTQLVDRSVLTGMTPEGQARLTLHRASQTVYEKVRQRQQQIRLTRRRDPEVDLDVTFVCRVSPMLNAVLGYVAGEFEEPVHELALRAAPAVDWSFWNSNDPDEKVPESEWESRDDSWREALRDKAGRPFLFQFGADEVSQFAEFSDLMPFLPTHQARAARRAEDRLLDTWLREQLDPTEVTPHNAVSKYLEFRDMLTDEPEWKARLSAEIEELQAVLPERLDTWWDTPQLLLSNKGSDE